MHRPISRGVSSDTLLTNSLGDGSTLTLDFTTGVLDPRLTFTRDSNATFINSQGLVEWAQANLMTRSNAFTTSPWASTNVSMTTDGESPVGSAWRMTENSALASVHRLEPSVVTCSNGVISISVYVKQGSGTRQAYFLVSDNATGDVRSKRLNPVDGSLQGTESTGGSWASASTSVVNVGGGWYRLVLTATKGGGSGVIVRMGMSDSGGNLSYNGDGTSYLLFSGVQINPGSVQPYVATSGSIYQAPRFDHDPTTLAPRGLLVEGTAVNVLTYSEQFNTSPWFAFNGSITANDGVAPDGNTTADSITPSGVGGGVFFANSFAAGTWTFSVWAKANTGNTLTISIDSSSNGRAVEITLSTATAGTPFVRGTGGTVSSLTVNSVTVFPNSWRRISITVVTTGSNFVAMYNGTDTNKILIWGAQLEAGSGASSYIPTGASQGTRNADNVVAAIANVTGFNANQGTMFQSWQDSTAQDTTTVQEWAFAFGLTSAAGFGIYVSNAVSGTFGVFAGSSNTGDAGAAGTYVINGINKAAVSINVTTAPNTGTISLSANGSAAVSGTRLDGYNQAQTLSLGQRNSNQRYLNGWIRQFKYWPYILPNAQLQSLTT